MSTTTFPHLQDGFTESLHRFWPARVEQFVGVITAGSGNGSDFSDERYYVERSIAAKGSQGSGKIKIVQDNLPGVGQTVAATNLAELSAHSHRLAAGTPVHVFAVYTRAAPAKKVYVFDQPPEMAVIVQISSADAGAGKYNGKVLVGLADTDASSDLGMPAGLSAPASDDAIVLNVEESGITGHRLENGVYAVGVIGGFTQDSPPKAIVFIRGALGRLDSPTTLSASDSSETAESTTWSKNSDGSPVTVNVVSRVVYNASGDQTLYAFVREMVFDARGVLSSIGAESRVTVDVTEACS